MSTPTNSPSNGSPVAPRPTEAPASVPMSPPIVPRWAVHRRLYNWVLSLAHKPHGTAALFLLSFAESSFFPIPPDVLQIALTLERRSRAFYYAAVSAVASVLGGVAGYFIGWLLWSAVDEFFFRFVFSREVFDRVGGMYHENAFWAIFTAAFTPIPYKVFTIAAGVFHEKVPLTTLIIASAIGRSGRFFLVAALLWWLGPPVKSFIDRYFNLLSIVFTVLLIGSFFLVEYISR